MTAPAVSAAVQVPMNDLSLQHATIREQMDTALAEVVASCGFILGPRVAAFEEAFARYCGVDHCVGVSNGTDALVLTLRALGVGAGDEVITTPYTFGATAEAICQVGARPVFVDVEDRQLCLDPSLVEAAITARTRVIMPVHIYGHPADMTPLLATAGVHNIDVVEDAAQAQGARRGAATSGSMGRAGCFSFYPGKNLGAYGDAGGITTNDQALAQRLRSLRNHGMPLSGPKFHYDLLGHNNRMDGIQGAVLEVKLPYLEDWNESRRRIADRYREQLGDVGDLQLPTEAEDARHVYHLFTIRTQQRDGLAAHLRAAGVSSAVMYPLPLHLTDAYAFLGHAEGSFPVSEQACREILSIPIFPELADDLVDHVSEQVRAFFGTSARGRS
jgi:dTDP-4-amino-4,6-dideoxygalactose transaminase